MAIASTNSVGLYINEEATWSEEPTGVAMQQLRYTGESLAYNKQTVVSETIRADRMRDQMALVAYENTGDMNFELPIFDFDPLMEGTLGGTWTGAKTITGTTIAFTSTAITDSANGLGDIPVNAYIWVSGAANKANNRRYRVTASVAGSLTVSPAPAATASAGATITISAGTVTFITAASTKIAAIATNVLTFSGSTGFNPTTQTNFVVGQYIKLGGFANAANNVVARISDITSTTITFTGVTLTDETVTAATTLTFTGRRLRNGTGSKSYHIEKAFTDIGQYLSMRGMKPDTMSLEINSGEIITGSFGFMGGTVERDTTSFATSTIATNTSPVLTGSANVGSILKNGAAIGAGVKSITLEVSNNLRRSDQIGSLDPYAINTGFQDVTGQIDVYFEDATLYDALINHTSTELSWTMTDDSGNAYRVTLPTVLFTEGFPNAGGGNDDVMIPLAFQAIRNATYDCQIQIDELPSLT